MKAKLYLVEKGEPTDFWEVSPTSRFRIGRAPGNEARPKAHGVSRHHAVLFLRDGQWFARDLGSTNGTLVNGHHLKKNDERLLEDGDTLKTGSAEFLFELWEPRIPTCPICGEGEVYDEHVLVGDELAREDVAVCVRCGMVLQELEPEDTFEFRFVPAVFAERRARLGNGPFRLADLKRLGQAAIDDPAARRREPGGAEAPAEGGELDQREQAAADAVVAELLAEAAKPSAPSPPAEEKGVSPRGSGLDAALELIERAERGEAAPKVEPAAQAPSPPPPALPEELHAYVPPSEREPAPDIGADELLSSIGVAREGETGLAEEEAAEPEPAGAGPEAVVHAPEARAAEQEAAEEAEQEEAPVREQLEDPVWVRRIRVKQHKRRDVEEEEEIEEAEEPEPVTDEQKKKFLAAKRRRERRARWRRARRAGKVVWSLGDLIPGRRRLLMAVGILILVGGIAWGYVRMINPSTGRSFMVRCQACGAVFPSDKPKDRAFDLKCPVCAERKANIVLVCYKCGHIIRLNSAAELEGRKCPSCGSPHVGFAYPGKDGLPGTLDKLKGAMDQLKRERESRALEGKGEGPAAPRRAE